MAEERRLLQEEQEALHADSLHCFFSLGFVVLELLQLTFAKLA
jgi:hypothetical protein